MIIGGVEGRGCEMLTQSFAWQLIGVLQWTILAEVDMWWHEISFFEERCRFGRSTSFWFSLAGCMTGGIGVG